MWPTSGMQVTSMAPAGTGVLIKPAFVLTAAHVVGIQVGPGIWGPNPAITTDGTKVCILACLILEYASSTLRLEGGAQCAKVITDRFHAVKLRM